MALRRRLASAGSALFQMVRGRLNRRLLTWFLVLSLAPLFITNAVGYSRSEDIIRRLIQNDLAVISLAQARVVDDRLERLLLLLQAITSGNQFLSSGAARAAGSNVGQMGTVASQAAMEEYLREKRSTLSAFDALFVLTPDRRIAVAAGRVDDLAIRGPLGEAPMVVASARSGVGAAPLLQFTVPLRNTAGTIVGYLGAVTAASNFQDLLRLPAQLSGGVDSYLVDVTGRPLVVSRPRGGIDFTRTLTSPLAMLPGGAHARYRTDEGVDVIGVVGAVPNRPFRFIAELPAAAVFGELQRLRYLSVALEIVFVVLLVLAARLVARDIVAPLHRLVDASRRLERGDLTARVTTVREPDELGELQRAFNEMAEALSSTTARVQEMHQHEIERAAQLATVGELASGVAHEIRNPVVGISSGLDLVQRHVGHDPKLAPIMDEMARQLARIRQTVQDLLAFARPATPRPSLVSSNLLIERAIRLIRPTAASAGVQVEQKLNPDMPPLLVDEDLLHGALVNLLMNAIEATPAGGRVDVSTSREGGECRLTVADNGRGIPEKDLDHIFKPFFTTRHTGTGLGLPITRDIVERHGGRLTLESRVGAGTTATIHLPLHSSVVTAAAADRGTVSP